MNFTISLIIINVIIYFILESMGTTESAVFMMEHGAVYPPYIIERGEYWRFFTATLMHFGFSHLLNNMVMLGAAGQILERALGKVKYLLLYFAAGIGGCVLSYLEMMHSGEYAVAAGASGSIFGIIGALAWILILHRGKYETLTGKGMVMMIILSLYYGVSTGDVDNWGHIGGFLMGFLISIIFYRRNTKEIDFGG
ncbi:MAG: rhomboid family intramembrane serine protease [Agathobacter sp.]|nr:rhomboid family intramembrane serine protease [Agathobacter sp.]